jgi:hypothetical protein
VSALVEIDLLRFCRFNMSRVLEQIKTTRVERKMLIDTHCLTLTFFKLDTLTFIFLLTQMSIQIAHVVMSVSIFYCSNERDGKFIIFGAITRPVMSTLIDFLPVFDIKQLNSWRHNTIASHRTVNSLRGDFFRKN